MLFAILMQYFTQNVFIFYVTSIQYDHLIIVETTILLFSVVTMLFPQRQSRARNYRGGRNGRSPLQLFENW